MSTVRSSLAEKIAFLYPEDAEEVYKKLQTILYEYEAKLKNRPSTRASTSHSEKDVILIAYADHVKKSGEKSLKTMNTFLKEFASGHINTVHFLPLYPYTSDDGFAVSDYYSVKPEFGDWSDLAVIHESFGLVYDFVANHVSASNPWFKKFLAGDPDYADFFLAYDEPIDTSLVYRPRVSPLLTPFQTSNGQKYVWTTFSADQIDLNVNNPEVFLALAETLLFYIEHGADTLRFDAVGYLWKDPLTSSAHLPQTHMIIKIFREIIDMLAPDASFVIQANTRQDINTSYFGNGTDEAHLIYNYSLPPLLLHSFIAGDAQKLSEWAKTLPYPYETTTYVNITASHDGIGLQPAKGLLTSEEIDSIIKHVSKRGAKVNYRSLSDGTEEPYEINATYRSALGDADKFMASQAIQLAFRGIPAVYFNSLLGATNWVEGVEQLQNNRAINRKKFNYTELRNDLLDPESDTAEIYNAYIRLLDIRAGEELFSPTVPQEILSLHPKLFGIKRTGSRESLFALTNVSGEVVTLQDMQTELKAPTATNILKNLSVDLSKPVQVEAYETLWLKVISRG